MSDGKKPTLQTQVIDNGNFTPVPNWLFDLTIQDCEISDSVKKVLLYLYRNTIGWNCSYLEVANSKIMTGANTTKPTTVHAIAVICDCWNLFRRTVGRKGGPVSGYQPNMEYFFDEELVTKRQQLTMFIYDTVCPNHNQLKDLPPTSSLYRRAEAIYELTGKEQKARLDALLREMTAKGKSERAARARANEQGRFKNKVEEWLKRPEYSGYTFEEASQLVAEQEAVESANRRVRAYNALGSDG